MTITLLDTSPLLPSSAVKELFGGISNMTLWRWETDSELGFPEPVRVRTRKFWKAAELREFIERQQGVAA